MSKPKQLSRNGLVVLALLAAVSCGGTDSVAPGDVSTSDLSMSVVSGDAQEDTVDQTLPDPIVVEVTGPQGAPVDGQLVNFVVVDSACGEPFAGSAQTDADGVAKERWKLGTVAAAELGGDCHMEARAVDQESGEPIIFATVAATPLPGPADSIQIPEQRIAFMAEDTFAVSEIARAFDKFGNETDPVPPFTVRVSSSPDSFVKPSPSREFSSFGDSLTAPSERDGWLRASSSEATMQVGNNGSVPVFAMFDFRSQGWSSEFRCVPGASGSYQMPEDTLKDRTHFDLRSTSLTYDRNDNGTLRNELTIDFDGTRVVRDTSGAAVDSSSYSRSQRIRQWTGFIRVLDDGQELDSGHVVSSSPRDYDAQLCLWSENLRILPGDDYLVEGVSQ